MNKFRVAMKSILIQILNPKLVPLNTAQRKKVKRLQRSLLKKYKKNQKSKRNKKNLKHKSSDYLI